MFVTQPSANGNPAFLSYPTIADVFGRNVALRFARPASALLSLAPRALKGSNDPSSDTTAKAAIVNAGARQAGLNGLLVDQSGNPVFYAIHMNSTFVEFIKKNGLTTKAAVQNASTDLALPTGAVELKSAWQIVPEGTSADNFITTRALVPTLKQLGSGIEVDEADAPREVTVALLAIHVVFALEGHPELIWATFEHVDSSGNGDLAPAGPFPANGSSGSGPVSPNDFLLYKGGTPASAANVIPSDAELVSAFDPLTQNFTKGGTKLQTSIFRFFPSSKLADGLEDDDIATLNRHVRDDFRSSAADDKRKNYRLVGAVWLDKRESTFAADRKFANPSGTGPDDDGAVVVGEDGLSSMAMESFTQDSFVNCFSCHDTRQVKDNGVVLMTAKKLNVSHIFSKFVGESK
ncbi:hypothetical protein QA649_11300 [Bradyrhizobium sp. CB1717]|uniref:hypothetical protein n=1 Tax=Bradyrhizobium sp. CB1717 TaxID=3039154 RepID=UPI0024B06C1A|nr:hypothetical protein [Bradyrhizobium sp. CB1717]WFU26763.1 hypothetical protein QA649_11300 [Bradyrhizobium sp. CB1717]